jgi:glutamate-1-semialdehyde 2,1-aminomutase
VTRDWDKNHAQPFRALFLRQTIKHGLLMPSLVVSFSHIGKDIDGTIKTLGKALYIYRKSLNEGVEKSLMGLSVNPIYLSQL